MAAKIFFLLALLALSVSTTNAFFSPQCSPAPTNAIIQQALANPATYSQLQQLLPINPLAAAIVVPYLQQQQLQKFLPALSQLGVANPAAYLQLQQLLPINPLAAAIAVPYLQQLLPTLSQIAVVSLASLQQQQLLPFNQLANAAAYLQQQQPLPFTQLALANIATYSQQQQLLPVNPLAAAFLPQQLLPVNPLVVANPLAVAFLQQQQLLSFNQMSLMHPALSWQQPIVGGAIF